MRVPLTWLRRLPTAAARRIRKGEVHHVSETYYPCLDVRDGRVVKGVNFVNIRDAGDPVELATYYSQAGGG